MEDDVISEGDWVMVVETAKIEDEVGVLMCKD
jgi:hypothetical protein